MIKTIMNNHAGDKQFPVMYASVDLIPTNTCKWTFHLEHGNLPNDDL